MEFKKSDEVETLLEFCKQKAHDDRVKLKEEFKFLQINNHNNRIEKLYFYSEDKDTYVSISCDYQNNHRIALLSKQHIEKELFKYNLQEFMEENRTILLYNSTQDIENILKTLTKNRQDQIHRLQDDIDLLEI